MGADSGAEPRPMTSSNPTSPASRMHMQPDVSLPGCIVIPTYNERENITSLVPGLLERYPYLEILVVDDASPDGTADSVREMQRQWGDRLHLLERPGKAGLGTAYIAGFRWVLLHRAHIQWIGEMDADHSHRPEDLLHLMNALLNGADVAIGSRYVPGGQVVNWPLSRILLSRGASIYVRFWTGMPVQDPTSGFVLFRRYVLERIPFTQIRFRGYAFQIAMKFLAWRYGFRLQEVPITFVDRVEGSSKMNRSIIWEAIWGVPYLVWQKWEAK